MGKIGISILCGLGAGIIAAIYKRPIDKKEKNLLTFSCQKVLL